MFGHPIRVTREDGFAILLRPPERSEMPRMAKLFSSMQVHRYTRRIGALTETQENKYFDEGGDSKDTVIWFIEPLDADTPGLGLIGVTAIHGMDMVTGGCTTGIMIGDQNWWGKGVATLAHYARTYMAATHYGRNTILTHVRVPNEPSRRALEKMGYFVTGIELRNAYREGEFIDTYVLNWINPARVELLYPKGLPKEYLPHVERAQLALAKAETMITAL